MTEQQSEQAAGLLYVTNNLERIADRCGEIMQTMKKIRESGKALSEYAASELSECFDIVSEMFTLAIGSVEEGNTDNAREVSEKNTKLRKAEKKFNKAHIKRVKNGECDPSLTSDFTGILYSLNRIADNCVSVAEEALDNVNFKELEVPDESILLETEESADDKKKK